ncbi:MULTISPECIES: MFS transporter [unclassified Mycolicibacterium]|uniref:MFS transporter n=1 Tax=unclassified Mycolicibacterium TaxID=2636767 RepID=UPI0012DDE92D|nr:MULTISPECIES: MFS transporter [unclassified Mycolicibacterium]MUL85715.1 MFS transporter [Mycolicibacterium sp. CBMA 329]MUL91592.1 MFS transporter [Mycolicibacterium sp. CBMA 331]MUM28000.1 MFS transporter [Mycolicibacterium sp. CBMA 295]MUM41118.1 MFS transporter [Mycolicibacterium sp. CBMA 247]MUM47547.1 MFS transporter [Mycolicibacterium sp. CBMA 294]
MTTSLERARSVVAPDPTVRVLAVFALALGGFGIGTTEFVAMGLLPDIAASFGITEPTAGHVISAYALGVVIGAPVIAALTARWPRKTLLLTLMAVFTLGNVASMLAPTYLTLVIARFASGLPHGAFFGIAALAAAHLMGPQNRAKAVAYVLCGLTVATVLGVPLASWLGQALGWRSAFGLVVVVGLVTLTAMWRWLPDHLRSMHVTSPMTELSALRRPQVWLAVLVGMIGFGGMFAVYTYISTTMTDVTGLPRSLVPVALMVFGLGMVVGNLIGGRLADISVIRALYLSLGALAALLAAFSVGSHSPWTALPLLFGVGVAGSAVGPALQTRLMDVAHDAQTLAAALNHSALNVGNATGAWVGGLVIAAGLGYTAPAAAGAVLAVGGLLVFTLSVTLQRRTSTPR